MEPLPKSYRLRGRIGPDQTARGAKTVQTGHHKADKDNRSNDVA